MEGLCTCGQLRRCISGPQGSTRNEVRHAITIPTSQKALTMTLYSSSTSITSCSLRPCNAKALLPVSVA